jgi:hypothetical protein
MCINSLLYSSSSLKPFFQGWKWKIAFFQLLKHAFILPLYCIAKYKRGVLVLLLFERKRQRKRERDIEERYMGKERD